MINVKSYVLTKAILTKGELTTDIVNSILEINMYESIDTIHAHGSCAIIDNYGLIEKLNLEGGEDLEFQIGNIYDTDTTSYKFKIYSIDRIILPADGAGVSTITIRIVSNGYYNAMNTRIAEYFNGSYTKWLKDITDELLREVVTIKENTTSVFATVIPNLKFNDAVKFILKKTISSNFDGFYMFETFNSSYLLQTISHMHRELPKWTYSYSVRSANPTETHKNSSDLYNILDYSIEEYSNKLEDETNGFYSGKSQQFNIYTRVLREEIVASTIDQFGHSKYMFKLESLTSDNDRSTFAENALRKYQKHNSSLNTVKLKLTIPGNKKMSAGDKITINLPSNSVLTNINDNSKNTKLSGDYIVKTIRQKYTMNDHVTIIDVLGATI